MQHDVEIVYAQSNVLIKRINAFNGPLNVITHVYNIQVNKFIIQFIFYNIIII
jgi:hypothetical protein